MTLEDNNGILVKDRYLVVSGRISAKTKYCVVSEGDKLAWLFRCASREDKDDIKGLS